MVAMALWVRSKAEAANAKKPPGFWSLGSPRAELTGDCCGRDRVGRAESGADSSGEDERGEKASVVGVLAVVLLGLMLGGGRRGVSLLLGEDNSRCGGGAAAGGQVRELRLGEDEVETEW